jgi:hypothetical protein
MPFKSEAQRRYFYYKASRPGAEGKKWKKHLRKFRKETPKDVKLPERVKTAAQKSFDYAFFSELEKISKETKTERIIDALPGIGALLGGSYGALRPQAFNPIDGAPDFLKKLNMRSKKGRLLAATLGAAAGSGIGELPQVVLNLEQAFRKGTPK